MAGKLHAVLIADVMSSGSRADFRRVLARSLASASRRHQNRGLIKLPYSIAAGDEFQTVASSLSSVPALVFDLRAAMRPLALRIGVGFGGINGRLKPPVNQLDGAAFRAARRAIDSVKDGTAFKFETLTAFVTPDAMFDAMINLIYGLQDTLMLQITEKQWAAIIELLDKPALEPAAKRLGRAISSVSRRLKRGYYWQLYETVSVAKVLIQRTF
jgi:uncharacterized protein (DUF1778 family)